MNDISWLIIIYLILFFTAVEIQGLPSDCQAEVDVDKRDNSGVDFIICLKKGQ